MAEEARKNGSKSGFAQAIQTAQNAGLVRLASYALQTLGGILLSIVTYHVVQIMDRVDNLRERTTKLEVRREADDKDTQALKTEIKESLAKIERQLEKLSDKIARNP